MDAAFDGLRAAIFEMYAAMEENDSRDGAEHQRRADALEGIDEVLEWRPFVGGGNEGFFWGGSKGRAW